MNDDALQSLKQQAKAVRAEGQAVANEDACRWWEALLTVAEDSLAHVWEYVAGKDRPHYFTAKSYEHEFRIDIPGHRQIVAIFRSRDFAGPCWWRDRYFGCTPMDVADGAGNWMVAPRNRPNHVMTYHHTLGSALVEAEER